MAIRASCSACGAKFKADDRHAGRTLACPGCRQPLTIPPAASVATEKDRFIDPFAEEAAALDSPPLTAPAPPTRTRKSPTPKPAASIPLVKKPATKSSERKPPLSQPPAEPTFDEEIVASEADADIDHSQFPDLSEEDLAGEALSPPKKRKQTLAAETSDVPSASPRKRQSAVERPATGWRQHLHWVLILALAPLVMSTVWGGSSDIMEQIQLSLDNHPEVNASAVMESTSLHDAAMQFPAHQLDGAFLPADTYWHWGFALASCGVFLSLFMVMWPGKESRVAALLTTGVITGTIGILLLLGFQWVAFSTDGVMVRGRGIGVLLFYIVKFVGFSYRCALDGNSGFLPSFFGFTFGVGLCEELCKALPVAFYLTRPGNRTFREVCLVGLASGVGFGVSEGITYSSEYYNGIHDPWIYVIRFLSCVSLHAIWAGGVALLMYRNQDYLGWAWESVFFFVVYYLLMAMILHGVYDTLLKQDHELLAVLSALVSFAWFQWILSRASREAGES